MVNLYLSSCYTPAYDVLGTTFDGFIWMLTVTRGIVGFGTGGEYPASSTSASEAANEYTLKNRGPIFILVTNLPLSFGGPFAVSVFLIVLKAAGMNHLETVWRVTFGIGCIWPLTVFFFRLRMLNSKLYRRGAIKRRVPYLLVVRYYWKTLIGTCGAWFLYAFPLLLEAQVMPLTLSPATTSSPSPTASSQAKSSPPSSKTSPYSRPASGNSSSAPSPFQVSSSALSSATSSDARTP